MQHNSCSSNNSKQEPINTIFYHPHNFSAEQQQTLVSKFYCVNLVTIYLKQSVFVFVHYSSFRKHNCCQVIEPFNSLY